MVSAASLPPTKVRSVRYHSQHTSKSHCSNQVQSAEQPPRLSLKSQYRLVRLSCPPSYFPERAQDVPKYTKRQLHGWSEQQAGASSYQSGYADDLIKWMEHVCRFVVRQSSSIHIKALYALTRRLITLHLIIPMGLAHLGSCISRQTNSLAMALYVHPSSHGWGNLEYGESRLINSNETSLGSIAPRFRRPLPSVPSLTGRGGAVRPDPGRMEHSPAPSPRHSKNPQKTAQHPGSCSCRLSSLSGIAFPAGSGTTK
jgi:hypothetical protein